MRYNTDLIIVTKEPFPFGLAASNRIITYAKEIAVLKKVKVLILHPSEYGDRIRNVNSSGKIGSFTFKYLNNTTIWPINAPKYKKAKIIILSYYLLIRELYIQKPKSILLVSNDLLLIWFLFFLSKIFSFKYFQEKSEKPPVLKETKVSYLYEKFYLFSYRLFSGIIVMTNELKNLFLSIKQNHIFLLPMTVDIDRFNNQIVKRNRDKYFFKYCGGGTYERDGLINMVRAFIKLREWYSNFEFHIIGPYDNRFKYIAALMQIIDENYANSYIKFLGEMKANEIPEILYDADFLIMTPPSDYVSGGFPTKLGEYLATGRPVICTNVSEIPLYLNNDNSILIEPDNHDMLVNALVSILECPDAYVERGLRGRVTVEKYFTMRRHTNNLINFLNL
jgi:glycosyltransferase involved in cell wall biosynthesis